MAANIGVKLGIDGEAEYQRSLKNITEQAKTLDKQMKTLGSSFDDEADSMEKNARKADLLRQKAEKLEDKIEVLKDMVEKAADMYGESSTECQKWEQVLADTETELNNTNAALEDHEDAIESASSALGELTSTIDSQKSEMEELRDAYIDAVLEFGEGSDEAEALAGQIEELNGSLSDNQEKLDNAKASYDNLIASMQDTGSGAGEVKGELDGVGEAASEIGTGIQTAASMFGPAIGQMVSVIATQGILGIISMVVEAVKEIGTAAWDAMEEFGDATASLAVATGLMGDELDTLAQKARNTWAAIRDEDISVGQATEMIGALTTALGENIGSNSLAEQAVLKFAATLGLTGANSVFKLTDSMKQWGMVADDDSQTVLRMIGVMNDMITTQAGANISVDTMANTLAKHAGEMQILGLSYQDAMGTLGGYVAAGGDVNTITMGMYQASKNLAGEVENVPAAWQQVIEHLQAADSVETALNGTIGNTGMTLTEVFNEKTARSIASTFVNGKADIDSFTESLNHNEAALELMYDSSRTAQDTMSMLWASIKTGSHEADLDVTEFGFSFEKHLDTTGSAAGINMDRIGRYYGALNELSDGSKSKSENNHGKIQKAYESSANAAERAQQKEVNAVKSAGEDIGAVVDHTSDNFNQATGKIRDTTEEDFADVAETTADKTADMAEAASNNLDAMSNDFSQSLNGISGKVSSAAAAWRSVIQTQIYGPKITAPMITYTKSGNNMIPHANYYTFAKAYDSAMLLKGATIFGAFGSGFLQGGEKAGAEVVVGESHLMSMFNDSVKGAIGYAGNGGLASIEALLRSYLPEIGNQSIYLDGDTLVGKTAGRINEALGRLDTRTSRGGLR